MKFIHSLQALLFSAQHGAEHAVDPKKAWNAGWAGPLVVFAAFLISWGAEAAQFMISQGLALAILAWLQTMPEFSVEADLAWNAGRGTPGYSETLVTANFTGSIRIIMGFGMPMVYFISTHFWSKVKRTFKAIELEPFHSVEIVSLVPPIAYFCWILHKGSLDIIDSIVMLCFYVLYLALLMKMPPEEEGEDMEELPALSRWVLKRGRKGRIAGVLGIFLLGGAMLYVVVHPFVESLQGLGAMLGISTFILIQWLAPFLSEMPEKVTAFNWARKEKRAAMALMNFLSSNLNQITVLVAMVPMVFAAATYIHGGAVRAIHFDEHQKAEVLLTICQALLCLVLLLNMKFEWWDAVGMFVLFIVQFSAPMWEQAVGLPNDSVRTWIVFVYLGWILLEVVFFLVGYRQWSFPLMSRRAKLMLGDPAKRGKVQGGP